MRWAGEPKLEEVLSDPIVRAVMARDRVDPEGLRLLLRNATKLLASPGGKAPDASAGFRQQKPNVADESNAEIQTARSAVIAAIVLAGP